MMKNFTQMKFGEYTFMHNPKTLTVYNKISGGSVVMPYCGSRYEAVALDNALIRGKGVITGSGCFERLLSLLEMLRRGESALLSVSPLPAVRAVLTSLEYTLAPKENTVEISFEFTSCSSCESSENEIPHSVIAAEGETLWDISYKYSVAVERLLQLNTFVKRPDILEKGQVIRLW